MKLHLKRAPIFKLNTARALSVLAVTALTVSAVFLSSTPARAQAANVTLQCQVSTNSTGYTLTCNGTTPDGSVALNCPSPDQISDNNGVYVVIAATCTGTVVAAGTTIVDTFTLSPLTVDSTNGSLTANDYGSFAIMINNGLSSLTVTGQGTGFTLTSSPFALALANGALTTNASVLGIGIAQITAQASFGGSVSVTGSPAILTINSPSIVANASLLGLIDASAACGSSVSINLGQIFPITIPLVSCNAS